MKAQLHKYAHVDLASSVWHGWSVTRDQHADESADCIAKGYRGRAGHP